MQQAKSQIHKFSIEKEINGNTEHTTAWSLFLCFRLEDTAIIIFKFKGWRWRTHLEVEEQNSLWWLQAAPSGTVLFFKQILITPKRASAEDNSADHF